MSQTQQQFKLWQRLSKRLTIFTIFIAVCLVILLMRLAYLQLVMGTEYFERSQRVIRKVVPLIAPRGEMFTRDYVSREKAKYITSNISTVSLSVIPAHFNRSKDLKKLTFKLERLLKLKPGSLVEKITDSRIKQNEEIVLIENLSPEQNTVLADYYIMFSKFLIRPSTRRHYNMGNMASHVTGYVGPPSRKDIDSGIKSYQLVGKNGLEGYYDGLLRGEDGEIVQIKSASGEVEEQKVFRNFIPGNNLILTIDSDLQKEASRALGDKTGAIIAIRPFSGEIMALVSKPDFDPNLLVEIENPKRPEHIKEIQESKAELNRAISTKYPPASTFKPLVALAALEENRIGKSQKYHCPGKFTLKSSYKSHPDAVFNDWDTHGTNDLTMALAHSCSVYFYQLGYHIGAEPIIKYSRYFKLDEKSQIDLPAEIPGFVPTADWKEKKMNLRWFDGDTINLSIGQGFIETTLVGMVNFYSALVTNGIIYRPHLVKEVRFAENDQVKESVKPVILHQIPMAKSSVAAVREGIRAVSTKGTARGLFGDSALIPVAGKTGTVQTRSGDRFANATQHAWYIGYGPYDGAPDKILLIGVFVDKGMGGARGAAPLAKDVFLKYTQKLKKGGAYP